ncbi:MAG: Segregation and condensation protein A [Chloroflexi bacterium]|nr:Segregation and condensation protein A [Chloroflexota bacterium]
MKLKFATHQVSDYQVHTPVYEGPLDLLLQLIENAELDITSLALAQVTDQYLEHMRDLEQYAAEEVSAFLVIAAKLLQIKSEALLPRPPKRDSEEEDLGDELARQLLSYKRYKEIAELLAERSSEGLQSYSRLAPPPLIKEKADFGDFTLDDLVNVAQRALGQAQELPALDTVVTRPKITIREKLLNITAVLKTKKRITFTEILGQTYNRAEVVVSFLAVLELIKRRYVEVRQDALFEDINLELSDDWDEYKEKEFAKLEFIE